MSGHGHPKITGLSFSVGTFTYQFFGSAEKLYRDWLDVESPHYQDRYCQRGFVTAIKPAWDIDQQQWVFTSKPIVSSIESSHENQWVFVNSPYELNTESLFVPSHQPDGCGMRDAYFDNDRQVLSCTWGQGVQCTSFADLSGANSGYAINHEDYGYDYPVYQFRRSRKGSGSAPDSDFYRMAGLQRVTSEAYGDRTFVILHDINQRFYAYPLKAYGANVPESGWPDKQSNVPDAVVKTADVPWPDEVTRFNVGRSAGIPTPADYGQRIKSLWTFSPDGKHAVTIAVHRANAWANESFTSARYQRTTGNLLYNVHDDEPIMVEIDFDLVLTGTDDDAFTFTIHLGRTVSAREDEQNVLMAAYAIADMGDIHKGDLLILEYVNYVDQPAFASAELGLLQRPTVLTLAQIKVHQDQQWQIVREWLAMQGCFASEAHEPRLFNLKLEDLAEIQDFGTLLDVTNNHFFYAAPINAMDLGSLSFCVSPMAWSSGTVVYAEQTTTAGFNAASIRVYAFNELLEQRAIGYSLLKTEINRLFDLVGFDRNAWMVVPITATVSLVETVNEGEVLGNSAILTSFLGTQTTITDYRTQDTTNFGAIDLFADGAQIYFPTLFKYFDGIPLVRPGFQQSESPFTSVVPATCDFTNYPVGAILLNKAYLTTLTPHDHPHYRLTVHPNQSIAYFYGPIMARKSVWFYENAPFADLEQATVDKIRMKVKDEFVESTHVACFNQAFAKTLTNESYHFTIEPAIENSVTVHWKPNAKDTNDYDWTSLITTPPIAIKWMVQANAAGWTQIYSVLPFSFVTNARYSTWSPFGVFPNPKIEGKWGYA